MPRNRRPAYGAPIGLDGETSAQLRALELERRMKRLNNWIGAGALSWLAAVLLVSLPIETPPSAVKTFPFHAYPVDGVNRIIMPVWVSQILYFVYFLLFSVMFYGIRKRKQIYWKLMPLFIFLFILIFITFFIWYMILGVLPWALCLFISIIFPLGGMIFCIWWQKQRGYFA